MEYKWIFCSSAVVMRYNVCYFALFSYFVSFFFIMPVMFVTSKPKYNNIPHSVHFFLLHVWHVCVCIFSGFIKIMKTFLFLFILMGLYVARFKRQTCESSDRWVIGFDAAEATNGSNAHYRHMHRQILFTSFP